MNPQERIEELVRENNALRSVLGQLRASRQYDMTPEQWDAAIAAALKRPEETEP